MPKPPDYSKDAPLDLSNFGSASSSRSLDRPEAKVPADHDDAFPSRVALRQDQAVVRKKRLNFPKQIGFRITERDFAFIQSVLDDTAMKNGQLMERLIAGYLASDLASDDERERYRLLSQ
tara:strand:+ start:962 stop:1321 length:360 start_codon:yes stop_codon:yes gene_type:complete